MKIAHTIALLIFLSPLFAQESPFKAGATVGINLSQVDGDNQFGYQKKGLTLGLRGGIVVQKKWSFLAELLYNFKGGEPSKIEKNTLKRHTLIDLHYAEVPLLAKFSFLKSEEGFYKWEVFGGISYSRLLQSKVNVLKNNNSIDTLELNLVNSVKFKTAEINAIFGISRYFSPKFGISLKHTVALSPFYDNPTAKTNPSSKEQSSYASFRNYFASATLFYDFVAPKVSQKIKKDE